MKTMKVKLLKDASEDKLRRLFEKHARYHRDFPADSKYSIRIGSGPALFSGDTKDLFEKFARVAKESTLRLDEM